MSIWADVLQLNGFSVHDSFLDLGGDSLSAMLCITRIRSAFGVEFSIEDFFLDNATVSDFARTIDRSFKKSSSGE